MNHNPNNFKKGGVVILDKEFNNSCKVLIITLFGLFTKVREYPEGKDTWNTIISRLSPLNENNETT